MRHPEKLKKALLDHLKDAGIAFSQVQDESMRERAVAKFSFDPGTPACILCGTFTDRVKELICIAHEAGHVMVHKEMNREETRNYICTMFAANKMGLGKIAPFAQAFVLETEARSSARGMALLRKIGIADGDLSTVRKLMSQWYASYEKQCEEAIVKNVRKKIMLDRNPAIVWEAIQEYSAPSVLNIQ
ncbi:MAG: hypothetical protein DRH37_02365 [Deltaproteobacteria bacterium]|nr:MAG: hypothetical protein DRH37_02365 [Deltaproteobacteria bacterium]